MKKPSTKLALVFISMLCMMFLYELLKQLIHPDISIWTSHTITIIFSSIIATIAAYILFNKQEELNKRLQIENKEKEEYAQSLNDLLEEKEVLLKEIHHRVKNNLNMVCNLLILQEDRIKNDELKEAFRQSRNRILSMSSIHEKLYKSKDLHHINFFDYLKDIAQKLVESYSFKKVISLNVDGDDFEIDIEKAIPSGLILTEIVSNAVKYAFPNNWHGEPNISIVIKQFGDGFSFSIRDNGIGLPKELQSPDVETLGLKLVHILLQQIHAKMTISNKKGTLFYIEYVPEKKD